MARRTGRISTGDQARVEAAIVRATARNRAARQRVTSKEESMTPAELANRSALYQEGWHLAMELASHELQDDRHGGTEGSAREWVDTEAKTALWATAELPDFWFGYLCALHTVARAFADPEGWYAGTDRLLTEQTESYPEQH